MLNIGIDVQPAKGQMFSSLADVAKHLQSLGVKVTAPSYKHKRYLTIAIKTVEFRAFPLYILQKLHSDYFPT